MLGISAITWNGGASALGETSWRACVAWHEPHAVRANAAPAAASPVSCAYAARPDARVKMRARPDATEFILALLIGFFEGIVPAYLVCANSAGAIYAGTAATIWRQRSIQRQCS
jgi:hypothetical protein